jgi:hypothetical protein
MDRLGTRQMGVPAHQLDCILLMGMNVAGEIDPPNRFNELDAKTLDLYGSGVANPLRS